MSYFFEMRFAQVASKEAMFNTCMGFANAVASRNTARRYIQTLLSKLQEIPLGRKERENFIQAAFQVQFVYWPQYNLLGLLTKSWPEELFGGFPFSKPVQFQDSTDQDYPAETWDSSIPFFEETKKYADEVSDGEVLDALGWEPSDFEELFSANARVSYIRRSFVYKEIFKRLDLNKWLNGEAGQFERFAVSGVTSTEKLSYLSTVLHAIAMELDEKEPIIRPAVWETAHSMATELDENSIKFLLSEISNARKDCFIRPGSSLADMIVNYKADQRCDSSDVALKEIEAGLKSVLAERYLVMYEDDEDARKNGWLMLCREEKKVKLVRGQRQDGDAWEYAVFAADWGGDSLILGTFPDAVSAKAFIAENGYTCVLDESSEEITRN